MRAILIITLKNIQSNTVLPRGEGGRRQTSRSFGVARERGEDPSLLTSRNMLLYVPWTFHTSHDIAASPPLAWLAALVSLYFTRGEPILTSRLYYLSSRNALWVTKSFCLLQCNLNLFAFAQKEAVQSQRDYVICVILDGFFLGA